MKDRGANVKAAGRELVGEDDLADATDCAAHLMKSVVDSVVLNSSTALYDKGMGSDVGLLLRAASYVRSNNEALGVFKTVAEASLAHLVPLKDNPTRWEGIDICVQRALRTKTSWQNFCKDPTARDGLLEACEQLGSDFPKDSFFERLQDYADMLTPLRVFSKRCQKTNEAAMPLLVFWIADVETAFKPSRSDNAAVSQLRAKFAKSVKKYLLPLVRGTTVATKAALLSPESRDIELYLSAEEIKACWKNIRQEALLLLDTTNEGVMIAGQALAKGQARMAEALLIEARAGESESWQQFWKRNEKQLHLFMPIAKLYMSMPVSSVKPETVFSYAGDLVTKKTNRWAPQSVEAHVLINDFVSQPDFSFEAVLEEVQKIVDEYDSHQAEKRKREREAKIARLERERQEIEEEAAAELDGEANSGEEMAGNVEEPAEYMDYEWEGI